MQDYKKILKLRFENKSQRYIADSPQMSRNTVKKVYDAADQAGLFWNDAQFLDNAQIYSRLFPKSQEINLSYQQPDYEYIHKELAKVEVSLQLLWEEYVRTCKANHKSTISVLGLLKNIMNMPRRISFYAKWAGYRYTSENQKLKAILTIL